MFVELWKTRAPLLVASGLAIAAAAGWSSFAYVAVSSGERVSALTAERDAAVADHQRLQASAGRLTELEEKIGSARIEYSRVVQGWADTRTRLGAAQQELATLTKRIDQAGDRVSQTGSIRQPEPPKRPAR